MVVASDPKLRRSEELQPCVEMDGSGRTPSNLSPNRVVEFKQHRSAAQMSRWTALSLVPSEIFTQIQAAIVFGSTGSEVILALKHRVLAFGTNVHSCLGSSTAASIEPREVKDLSGLTIVDLSFGAGPHVLALTEHGEVYSWGYNAFGQLGQGHIRPCNAAQKVQGALVGVQVTAIACGGHHSVAISSHGDVYTWGNNSNGQLGLGSTTNEYLPRKVLLPNRLISSVSCGHDFTVALARSGDVFAWGNNSMGQAGAGSACSQLTPLCLEGLSRSGPIIQVSCGYAHALALTDVGKLFVWGTNSCGQLANSTLKSQPEPIETVQGLGRISQIAAIHACNMTSVQTTAGDVYMWGLIRGQTISSPYLTTFQSTDDVFACFASPTVCWRPLRQEVRQRCGLIDALRAAFDDPQTADLKIHVDGRMLNAHRSLLIMRSAYLKARLDGPWAEQDGELEIKDFSFEVFRSYLRFLYTDELDLEDPGLTAGLLELASCYCEDELRTICAAKLQRQLCIANATQFYQTAVRLNISELEETAFRFCLNHMTAVTQSDGFRELDECTLKRLIARASREGIFKR